ncbi:hypothetical protein PDQ79_23475 [Bacillus cereus]|uniref:Uncharacterized protein n=1 Tax=Bacillus fungorum TaxID=2039284 RepID=A0A2G6Q7E4_9BACI|nr:hypothetical protein [Bacillus fungorum]MDA2637462.1 hypothetical protein [Bacillus cereus]PIE92762.1 hypothetical protein CO726_24660 [Bacillus fungorum]
MKKKIQYIIYLFSYLPIYIFAYPVIFILGMAMDSPNEEHYIVQSMFYIFIVLITIGGAWVLNFLFRVSLKLEKNTVYTKTIFIMHLVLIPATPYVFLLGLHYL